jgi:hypothetical protein
LLTHCGSPVENLPSSCRAGQRPKENYQYNRFLTPAGDGVKDPAKEKADNSELAGNVAGLAAQRWGISATQRALSWRGRETGP